MKKIDLIQTTILIIALILGYQAISTLINWLPRLFFSLSEGNLDFIFTFLLVIALGICCWILIKRSRPIAIAILKNEPESQDDFAQLKLDRNHLIFALLIGIGLYYLVWSIPNAALDLFKLYQYKVARASFRSTPPDSDRVIVELLRIILGAFIIYGAPTLTRLVDRLEKPMKRHDP